MALTPRGTYNFKAGDLVCLIGDTWHEYGIHGEIVTVDFNENGGYAIFSHASSPEHSLGIFPDESDDFSGELVTGAYSPLYQKLRNRVGL